MYLNVLSRTYHTTHSDYFRKVITTLSLQQRLVVLQFYRDLSTVITNLSVTQPNVIAELT